MEKKKEIYLGKYAMILRVYMKEENPGMYEAMKKAGTLKPFLERREDKYLDEMERLTTEEGMNPSEARELLWDDLMSIPMEDVKKEDDE